MSAVAWTITQPGGGGYISLAAAGLQLASLELLTAGADRATLVKTAAFDSSASLWAYREAVTIRRDGTPFFSGVVTQTPRMARPGQEEVAFILSGPWWWLEQTIYQQDWAVGAGSTELPFAVLGMDSSGDPLTTSEQVAAVLDYLLDTVATPPFQLGTFDAGIQLWPTEVRSATCAEVIRQQMRLHPSWVLWFDHSTSPPTVHFRERANLTSASIAVSGANASLIEIRSRDDLKVDAVRLTYHTASSVDGEIYRSVQIDKYPALGPDNGPGVLSAVLDLAGLQSQTQKSRIQTRALPTDETEAKAWLSKKYPAFAAMDAADWTVQSSARALVVEDDAHPDPVNPEADRLTVDTIYDLPRELVRGSIEDWMRVKVGKIKVTVEARYTGSAVLLPDAVAAALGPTGQTKLEPVVTATNATTKVYHGLSSWTPPEDAPAGIAQAVYAQLSTLQYEGAVELRQEDVPATTWHGAKLNLTGGLAAWTTMDAIVHSVRHDVAAGRTTISFGPPGHLGPQDLMELARMFRRNHTTWFSSGERAANTHGSSSSASSRGDLVDGYDQPGTDHTPTPSSVVVAALMPKQIYRTATGAKCVLHAGRLLEFGHGDVGCVQHAIIGPADKALDAATPPVFALLPGNNYLRIAFSTEPWGEVTGDVTIAVSEDPGGAGHAPSESDGEGTGGELSFTICNVYVPASASSPITVTPISPFPVWIWTKNSLENATITFVDCENNEVGTLEFKHGLCVSEDQTFILGNCETGGGDPPNGDWGLTCDIIWIDCTSDPSDVAAVTGDYASPGPDPPRHDIDVIHRQSFEDGLLMAVDASIFQGAAGARPLATTRYWVWVQSCCYVDDAPDP